ncbi:MAG TPA: 30S ribosomal protein S6--L-glutamate ligase, partial [Planctomycetota bacterium]|nr:30S ribosomal protein S6--L-glutamate ligase [Planctomycetota bacterium]
HYAHRPAGRDGRGNLVYGAQPAALQPAAVEARLALAAARALALDVAAVDLLVHEGRALVLEVNSAPGLIGIERATGVDVAGAIAELVAARLSDEAEVV